MTVAAGFLCFGLLVDPALGAEESAATLPPGVTAVWDIGKASREATATRERVCLNGLWRWQPAGNITDAVPAGTWGFFKVPGPWPGIGDYMQKECQTIYPHATWKEQKLGAVTAAWYQRAMTIPAEWAGRRIALQLEYLNSYGAIYIDGQKAGEIRFPGGDVDLTSVCRPGGQHVLSIQVVALPLKGVLLSYTDSASAREVKGSVARRGLCGDVYLIGTPTDAGFADVKVETSVRRGEVTFDAALQRLASDKDYTLRARISRDGEKTVEFTGKPFKGAALQNGRIAFTEKWKPDRLWDLHTASNMWNLELSLVEAGKVVDAAWPVRFGFREFWIDGRDFFLNGSRIFLSAVPLDNAAVGAASATYEGVRESLERLKSFGINFVYTHNYGCEPGSHLSFAETLRAADDAGMLIAFSQPHFSHYDWKAPDADQNNGYARHAEFYVRAAQNHPSVVFYTMSHNATGYYEDMNPDMIDGLQNPRDQWAMKNANLALRAEAIVHRLDPDRIVYHHASGNLGSIHDVNFYANFAPIQELSDWFEHWANRGVKPAFTCEYGVPFTWDWTMYRGWYQGKREFGSAQVPWEFCLAEWNSQFLGDRAFQISDAEKKNLRWEAKQFRAGKLWHRWDYPGQVGSSVFEERYPVFSMYLTDNWRAFRTWGVSATSPWEHEHFWKLREGVDRGRQDFKVDWENLQRPGFSADFLDHRYERMDLAFERSDWLPTPAAQALIRNNGPLLAYIAGKPAAFTSKDHNFHAGETFEKQIVIINNSRETVTCRAEWSLGLPQVVSGTQEITLPTGEQVRLPIRIDLPTSLAPGHYELNGSVQFSNGDTQRDSFTMHVLPKPSPPPAPERAQIALFDPKGETSRSLAGMGISCTPVDANADLSAFDTLIVGKSALTLDGAAPDITRVRDGLKVVLFEQTSEVLEKRFGFRVAEYGLRWVFPRVPEHPIVEGLSAEHFYNWRGEATLLPPRLKYEIRPLYGVTVKWCDLPVTRLWRCGNRGNVASVLIEKPARGDFLPILDGGFGLQYSPLLEYHEGKGLMLFCQMDVTGRTEPDPAAETLTRNILHYTTTWRAASPPSTINSQPSTNLYAGDSAGKRYLESAGIPLIAYEGGPLSTNQVLIAGPLAGQKLAANRPAISDWLHGGGRLLAIALDDAGANSFLPFQIATKKTEHIAAWFPPFGQHSLFAGVSPADVHNRDPREMPLITAGGGIIGDGILARAENMNAVFCQVAPWQFDDLRQSNLKRTYRRSSFLVARMLANLGVASSTPILSRFSHPVTAAQPEKRWLDGLYLDQPEEWDDPYRFFRW